jgi:plastocyanin
LSGTTISFNLNVTGHPFEIQDAVGNPYNTGLTHVATNGTVSTGSNAQGQTSGTLYWDIQRTVAGTFRYQCQSHAAMVGQIVVKDLANI